VNTWYIYINKSFYYKLLFIECFDLMKFYLVVLVRTGVFLQIELNN